MSWKPEGKTYKFEWNASDNGAVATHNLGNLPENFVVTSCIAVVKTALVGGGTIVCGEDAAGDADGYFLNLDAASVGVVDGTGALVALQIPHLVDAAKDGVLVTVATTLYSAGEVHFFFEGFQS